MKLIPAISIISMSILFFGCGENRSLKPALHGKMKTNPPELVENNSVKSRSTSSKTDSLVSHSELNKTRKAPIPKQIIHFDRWMEFPSDRNWNGAPMRQQIELASEILKEFPDTLSKLALSSYKSYDQFFPVTIADNFEEGISTEIINYPKRLVFQYEVFENDKSNSSYITKYITIMRNVQGEPYVE